MLSNPLIRSFLSTITRLLQPPQPIAFCADMDEAFAFLTTVRGPARSYAKASYKAITR